MSYFKTGRTEMTDMKDVSFGLSKKGMEKYIEDLKLDIEGVKKAVKDVAAIQKAIDQGWQGNSRDVFYQDFDESIDNLLDSISKEYKDLKYRLAELEDNMINQDVKMYHTN